MRLLRRRMMLTKETPTAPWEEMGISLNSFTIKSNSIRINYNSENQSLRVYTQRPITYAAAECTFITTTGYEYLVVFDLLFVSGKFCFAPRYADNSVHYGTGILQENRHISTTFPSDSAINKLAFFPVWNISENGDCTISNFHIYRRPAV